jgi:hypothetical protein
VRGRTYTCPSCRVRYAVGAPLQAEPQTSLDLNDNSSVSSKMRALRLFAVEFDGLASEQFSALEFIDWLEPSIIGSERHRVTISITSLQAGAERRLA